MADINIPGISDKYKTNDLVAALVEAERIPLKREQDKMDGYKFEQKSWQRLNQYMSSLRETARSLFSFDNPFSEKLTSSSQEFAITASAGRDAALESFKIDIDQIAKADRFLSKPIENNTTIESGQYSFSLGEKTLSFNWKGGTLEEFISAINRRSNGIVKASLIGVTKNTKSLLIEALQTGSENKLRFTEKALDLAIDFKLVEPALSEKISFGNEKNELVQSQNLPNTIELIENKISLSPESGFEIKIPQNVKNDTQTIIEFTMDTNKVPDITEMGQIDPLRFDETLSVEFKGLSIHNDNFETALDEKEIVQREPVISNSFIYLKMNDGNIIPFDTENKELVRISLEDYPQLSAIVVENKNTGKELLLSSFSAYNPESFDGYSPINAISIAQDAKLRYEGIPMSRPTNTIDDIVPHITLHLENETERTATIQIKPDEEKAKDALITFVGNYNQLIAEMNILSQANPEIIDELQYFTKDETEEAHERLGLFRTEYTVSSSKSALQRIITNSYNIELNNTISMLSQIGIASKASSGGGLSNTQLRGYLEIDEKKLDDALKNSMNEIKNLFGLDTDGDLIVDSGIGFLIDQQLQAYVTSGGILSMKNASLDTKISSSQKSIDRLEVQIAKTEQDLKRKYGNMESALNSLQSQSDSLTNFTNSYNNNK